MIELKILEKTYIVARYSSVKSLKSLLKKELEQLDIKILNIDFEKDRYAMIKFEGPDEIFAKNYLIERHGTQRNIEEIEIGDKVFGRFIDVGKVNFGFFVDIGIETSTKGIEALYPLFELRNQLFQGKGIALQKIVTAYGIVENLPMFFEITKKQVIGSKIWVKLSEESLQWLESPIKEKKEALIVCGSSRRAIKQALIQTGHFEDIVEIDQCGLLEYRLICKKGTIAEGIIPEIGGFLGRAKIGVQIPKRVRNLVKDEK